MRQYENRAPKEKKKSYVEREKEKREWYEKNSSPKFSTIDEAYENGFNYDITVDEYNDDHTSLPKTSFKKRSWKK